MSELRASIRLRDGQTQTVCVQVQTHLTSLIGGLSELNHSVTRLLSDLVERERARGACAQDFLGSVETKKGEEEEDDSEEDEEPEEEQNCGVQPPSKRSRT